MAVTIPQAAIGVDIIMVLTASDGNPMDLSTATAMKVYLLPPNAALANEKAAGKIGSGKEGKLIYTTVSGDLPVAGAWRIQSRVLYGSPLRDLWSSIHPFVVLPNLV